MTQLSIEKAYKSMKSAPCYVFNIVIFWF